MVSEKGILLVLSGPSGSGKGTVCKALKLRRENLHFSISATTRDPRDGEVNCKDYYFLTNKEFKEMIEQGKFLEWANVYNCYYGTPLEPVEQSLNKGLDIILEIDVQGALQVKEKFPQAVMVFLLPPTPEELSKRLHNRNTDSCEEIELRLNWARKELEFVHKYDYIVINSNVDNAAKKIDAILEAEKCRPVRCVLDTRWFDL